MMKILPDQGPSLGCVYGALSTGALATFVVVAVRVLRGPIGAHGLAALFPVFIVGISIAIGTFLGAIGSRTRQARKGALAGGAIVAIPLFILLIAAEPGVGGAEVRKRQGAILTVSTLLGSVAAAAGTAAASSKAKVAERRPRLSLLGLLFLITLCGLLVACIRVFVRW